MADRVRHIAETVVEEARALADSSPLAPLISPETQATARAAFSADPIAQALEQRVTSTARAQSSDRCYCCDTAKTSRQLSALAYKEPDEIRAEAKRLGFDDVRIIEDPATGTQGFVAADDERAYVVFRGTEEAKDLKTCFDFRRTPAHGGSVHSGFKRSADSVRDQVRTALADIGGDKETVVCGHSLGGAVAELTALDLAKSGREVEGVHVFGAPRVGDKGFAAEYDRHLGAKTHLHVRKNDPIPRVPPRFLGFADVSSGHGRNCAGERIEVSPGGLAELRIFKEIAARARSAQGDRDKLREVLAPYVDQHRIAGYELHPTT